VHEAAQQARRSDVPIFLIRRLWPFVCERLQRQRAPIPALHALCWPSRSAPPPCAIALEEAVTAAGTKNAQAGDCHRSRGRMGAFGRGALRRQWLERRIARPRILARRNRGHRRARRGGFVPRVIFEFLGLNK